MEKITSVQNATIKRIVRLREKKGRKAKGLTIVEGVRELRQAIKAGLRISGVYFCREGVYHCPDDLIAELETHKVRLFDTNCTVYDKISYGDRKEGVLGLVEPPELALMDLKLSDNPLVVILERVEKPGNLGAILRTCDGAGVEALLVCDEACDIANPNVIRSSLGAIFSVPTVSCSNEEALEFLKKKNIRIAAAVVDGTKEYFANDFTRPTAIVLGSEQDGLSAFWNQNSNDRLRIPMTGKVDSLNVSVSAAIMIYEVIRQRSKKRKDVT